MYGVLVELSREEGFDCGDEVQSLQLLYSHVPASDVFGVALGIEMDGGWCSDFL